MHKTDIPIVETGYFSELISAYISSDPKVSHLYGNSASIDNVASQIAMKTARFTLKQRQALVTSLEAQYSDTIVSEKTRLHINALSEVNTFTVVTGHQLNIFTGPLYFLYKIVTTINTCKALKDAHPTFDFVPVYWMATEDHDFEEINHFFVHGKKMSWEVPASGPVGRHTTEGLNEVFDALSRELGTSENAVSLKNLFKKAYLEHATLAEATRYLVNALFADYGLVILDGDDSLLKTSFAPVVTRELTTQFAHKAISEANTFLSEHYKLQVTPRNINLFYIKDKLRERIVVKNNRFLINNTTLSFSKEEILHELELHPERFSPNVILRPLYQEIVLPNLAYVGGGGELAYWLQLKNLFTVSEVPFPILLLRNSVLLATEKQAKKVSKLQLSFQDLFKKQDTLISEKVKKISSLSLDFSKQKQILDQLFADLYPLVSKTDISFKGALSAQEKKQRKGLAMLEKRLLKAEKKKHADHVERILLLQDTLFPRKGLQERNVNFSEFYLEYGTALIPNLISNLESFQSVFTVLIK
ncbi:MAG: bacillithiol biosynthesis cysteine-adding enzyme BshC [Flavicella sp.]